MNKFPAEDFYKEVQLPCWATAESDGSYMEVGAILPTRDGKLVGNAIVVNVYKGSLRKNAIADIITDFGNTLCGISEEELRELYHHPLFISDLEEHLSKIGNNWKEVSSFLELY